MLKWSYCKWNVVRSVRDGTRDSIYSKPRWRDSTEWLTSITGSVWRFLFYGGLYEVVEVVEIDTNMLQNASGDNKEYIKGVIEFNNYLLTVIDINKVVNI